MPTYSISGNAGVASATVAYSGLALTPLGSDTFQRADENPLDAAQWTVTTGYAPFQIVSDELCTVPLTSSNSAENFTAVSFPDDVYLQIQADDITDFEFGLFCRDSVGDGANCYALDVTDNGSGGIAVFIAKFVSTVITPLFQDLNVSFTPGDVFTFVVRGSGLYAYQNGVLIGTATDGDFTTGAFGGVYADQGVTPGGKLSYFEMGSVGAVSGSVTANGSGNYTIPGLYAGSYTITPSKTGYTFSPLSRNEAISSADITGVNFTATQASNGGAWFLSDQVNFLEDIPRRRGH